MNLVVPLVFLDFSGRPRAQFSSRVDRGGLNLYKFLARSLRRRARLAGVPRPLSGALRLLFLTIVLACSPTVASARSTLLSQPHPTATIVILSEAKDLSRTPDTIFPAFDFQLSTVNFLTSKTSPQSRSPYHAARASSSPAANSSATAPKSQTLIRKP